MQLGDKKVEGCENVWKGSERQQVVMEIDNVPGSFTGPQWCQDSANS